MPMSERAISYFTDYEISVADLDDFDARVSQVRAFGQATGLDFAWRGQADARWGIHSSLHRALQNQRGVELHEVREQDVVEAETHLVSEAREWIRPSIGARLTTIDLLARLQHHGVPTRLVDFTKNPYVALYFATVDAPGADGRIIIAAGRSHLGDEFRNDFGIPWQRGSGARPPAWDSSLHVLDDQEDFLRISRQVGLFLVGGTPSTNPQRRVPSTRENLLAADVRQAMSLPLALHSWKQAEAAYGGKPVRGRRPTIASALTLRVEASAKAKLQACLASLGFSAGSLFPDLEGLKTYGPATRSLLAAIERVGSP